MKFLLLALLAGSSPLSQQQPQQKPNQFNRPIIVPFLPRDSFPAPRPMPQPTRPGIEAPRPRTGAARPNPTVLPGTPGLSESLNLTGWSAVKPTGTDITFFLPEVPEERRTTVTAGGRELAVTKYVYSRDDLGAYVIAASDLTTEQAANTATAFRGARDRVVASLNGRLLTEERINERGLSGVELLIRVGEDELVRQRLFINGGRFLQAIAVGPKEFVRSAQTEKYFRAVRLNDLDER